MDGGNDIPKKEAGDPFLLLLEKGKKNTLNIKPYINDDGQVHLRKIMQTLVDQGKAPPSLLKEMDEFLS